MVKHDSVAVAFAEGETDLNGSRMFIDGNVIYSYGYHFPIALRLEDGVFLFNSDGYSISTARHKNKVKQALQNNKVVYLNTNKIKEIIDKNIKSYDTLITSEILEELEKEGVALK